MEKASKSAEFSRARVSPWGLLAAASALVAASTAIGFLGSHWWGFDLFAHFRAQYFWFALISAVVFVLARHWQASIWLLLIALVNGVVIAPAYLGRHVPGSSYTNSGRAMLVNVRTESRNFKQTEAAIRGMEPDILVLQEISSEWLAALSNCLSAYPYAETAPREDNFGIGLFSKWPLIQSSTEALNEAEVPTILAKASLPSGRLLQVIATHPLPPGSAENAGLRDDQLLRIAGLVRENREETLVLGDLNTTPWSFGYRRFLRESGMRDSAKGYGIQPTWPAHFPPLLIPLDHCLHTGDIIIKNRFVGPRTGSDHLPVVVEFAMP